MKYYLVLEDFHDIKKGMIVSEIDEGTIDLGGRFDKKTALEDKMVKEVKIKIIEKEEK